MHICFFFIQIMTKINIQCAKVFKYIQNIQNVPVNSLQGLYNMEIG